MMTKTKSLVIAAAFATTTLIAGTGASARSVANSVGVPTAAATFAAAKPTAPTPATSPKCGVIGTPPCQGPGGPVPQPPGYPAGFGGEGGNGNIYQPPLPPGAGGGGGGTDSPGVPNDCNQQWRCQESTN
jgi:hypothetical protein